MAMQKSVFSPLCKKEEYRSEGIEIGDFYFLSLQTPLDKEGNPVGKDTREEMLYVFKKMQLLLLSRDLGLSDIMQLRIYVTDNGQIPFVKEVLEELFGEPKPAITILQVESLDYNATLGAEGLAINTREMKACKRHTDGQKY